MVKMIATKPQTYGHKTLAADDEFEAENDAQAQMLVSLGRARRKDDTKGTKVEPLQTGTRTEKPAEPETGGGKYGTRRLKADDEPK